MWVVNGELKRRMTKLVECFANVGSSTMASALEDLQTCHKFLGDQVLPSDRQGEVNLSFVN